MTKTLNLPPWCTGPWVGPISNACFKMAELVGADPFIWRIPAASPTVPVTQRKKLENNTETKTVQKLTKCACSNRKLMFCQIIKCVV